MTQYDIIVIITSILKNSIETKEGSLLAADSNEPCKPLHEEKNDLVLGIKLMKAYFDFIYNPVYDFTTAQRVLYHRLQTKCVNKFKFHDGDRVLCAGVGTGNEVVHILKRNKKVSIVGVDYSSSALRKVTCPQQLYHSLS